MTTWLQNEADLASTYELLTEAREAYHLLNTGRSVRVFVDQNGERVEYSAASASRLRQYIAELEATYNREQGDAATQMPRGPMGVRF